MNTRNPKLITGLIALSLMGCASTGPEQNAEATQPEPNPSTESMSSSPQSLHTPPDPRALADQLPQGRLLHFDFDQASIQPMDLELLKAHAQFLKNHPETHVRLEGHADERGSREYNMGLGERRALTVQKTLILLGVGIDQLSNISYGEEKPLRLGKGEESFRENRRVELVYPQHRNETMASRVSP